MNKSLLFFSIFSLLFVGMFGFALAAENKSDANKSDEAPVATLTSANSNASGVSNMTYGSCVSQYAKVKNECYANAKQVNSADRRAHV